MKATTSATGFISVSSWDRAFIFGSYEGAWKYFQAFIIVMQGKLFPGNQLQILVPQQLPLQEAVLKATAVLSPLQHR